MDLPFTTEQFLELFRRYNEAVWPAQWALLAAGAVAVAGAARGTPRGSRVASTALGLLWLWMGGAYHLLFFRRINPAATLFGLAFLAQGVGFLWLGAVHHRIPFTRARGARGLAGGALVAYALFAYPLLARALGQTYPVLPTFGLPCPTTILTLGLLLWATPRSVRLLAVVPLLWAAVGASAAAQLGMLEDWGLPVAGLVLLGAMLEARVHRARPRSVTA